MKKKIYLTTLLMILSFGYHHSMSQGEFITRWDLSKPGSGATQIQFRTTNSAGATSYTWQEISPGSANGSGSFIAGANQIRTITGLPTNAIIRLEIAPTNLQMFIIVSGADRERLVDVEQWGTTNWTSMQNAFYGCSNLNITASDIPNLSGVSNMGQMFRGCSSLNGPSNIGLWNTSDVTEMNGRFNQANFFNQNIGSWNTSSVTNMSLMFASASAFNQDISTWNTVNVKDMSLMFYWSAFDQNIGGWNTSAVTDMNGMFSLAGAFNQNIGSWNTTNVTNMDRMFFGASAFNQNIGSWNTANVSNMGWMFSGASAFNQNISTWNTANVSNMDWMFSGASAFNQNISTWNTANVSNMARMFFSARSFNQDIGSWTLHNSVNLWETLDDCGMDCNNYSATLKGWHDNNPLITDISLGASGRKYTQEVGATERNSLVSTRNWTIYGDDVQTQSAWLVPNESEVIGILNCNGEFVNPFDPTNKIIEFDTNGNSGFSKDATEVTTNAKVVESLSIGVVDVPSGGGYYEVENGTNVFRISRRMISITNSGGPYTANGGVRVRVYYDFNDTTNIRTDGVGVGLNPITRGYKIDCVNRFLGQVPKRTTTISS